MNKKHILALLQPIKLNEFVEKNKFFFYSYLDIVT